jgi:tryptophan synthase alpha chain
MKTDNDTLSQSGTTEQQKTAAHNRYPIMAHMIPFYPNREISFAVARALIDGGVKYLEIQFPFSDPTADGPAIQKACSQALAAGFRISKGFEFIREIRAAAPHVPVFLMTYGSLVVAGSVPEFVRSAAEAGVTGLIIPDLPFDYDEGLYAAGRNAGIEIVPVVVPSASQARVAAILDTRPAYVYAALRTGITGSDTMVGSDNIAFLNTLRGAGTRILAGFGIKDPSQVQALAPHVDAAVVGSAFVRAIEAVVEAATEAGSADAVYHTLVQRARELTGVQHAV